MSLPALLLTALIGGLLAGDADAQDRANADAVRLGADIATKGGGDGVAPCASCHGVNGEGNAAAHFPRLAAQSALYLERQLDAFANASRYSNAMTPIASAMTPTQRHAAAEHYASISVKTPRSSGPASSRPPALATVGDARLRVQACANCHGPDGQGEPPSFPYLAGQPSAYLVATLNDWKKGFRKTDATGHMSQIARALSDDQMTVLAQYYERQPPPTSVTASVQAPTTLVTVPSTQPKASQPQDGEPPLSQALRHESGRAGGIEQGAPTTGGAQGPGGGGAANEGADVSKRPP